MTRETEEKVEKQIEDKEEVEERHSLYKRRVGPSIGSSAATCAHTGAIYWVIAFIVINTLLLVGIIVFHIGRRYGGATNSNFRHSGGRRDRVRRRRRRAERRRHRHHAESAAVAPEIIGATVDGGLQGVSHGQPGVDEFDSFTFTSSSSDATYVNLPRRRRSP